MPALLGIISEFPHTPESALCPLLKCVIETIAGPHSVYKTLLKGKFFSYEACYIFNPFLFIMLIIGMKKTAWWEVKSCPINHQVPGSWSSEERNPPLIQSLKSPEKGPVSPVKGWKWNGLILWCTCRPKTASLWVLNALPCSIMKNGKRFPQLSPLSSAVTSWSG